MDLFLILLPNIFRGPASPCPLFPHVFSGNIVYLTADALKTTSKISILSKMLEVVLVQPVGMFAVPRQPGTG